MLWLVTQTGWHPDEIRDMDVLTFNAIANGLTRLHYLEKAEQAWTNMIASQGESKAMRSLTNGWMKAIGEKQIEQPQHAPAGGAKEFLKALGIGPGGGSF